MILVKRVKARSHRGISDEWQNVDYVSEDD